MKLDLQSAQILAQVAHEMRQPLTAAVAAFQVLLRDVGDTPPESAWGVLDRQFKRLARLLDDLSETTRSAVIVKRLHVEHLDLRDVVTEAAQAVTPQLARKCQRFEIDLPPVPVRIEADWARLQQVLSNLFLNGIKYTPPTGVLRVRLREDAGDAVLVVSDTGCGIHADLLPKVFDAFASGDDPSARGIGVGLAIAREFVELHGGTIHATSLGVGRGSEFVVRLPLRSHGSGHAVVTRATNRVHSARA